MKTIRTGARPAILLFLLALALAVSSAAQSGSTKDKGKEKDQNGKSSTTTTFLLIHVVGGEKPAAVANANVYLRFQQKSALLFLLRRNKKIELDLKTDHNGYASFPELPQGKLLIQVVAGGWKAFGEYYSLDQPKQTIEIKLERPKTHWY